MNTIRQVGISDYPVAETLLRDYPYKRAQQRSQGLDPARLVPFYLKNIRGAIESGGPHWLAESFQQPVGLAGVTYDKFHSGAYGMRMGKLQPFLNFRNPKAGEKLLEVALDWCFRHGYSHLATRIDAQDFANIQLMERARFATVDVSLKMSRPLPYVGARIERPAAAEGWTVGVASAEDHPWIRALGSRTHGGTHFLNDPLLPRENTIKLFAKWIDRCLAELAWCVYVLRDGDGVGRGFVTYLRNPRFAEAVGREPLILDFALLAPEARGAGIGPWFLEQTLVRASEHREPFDFCELRTSAHNLHAVVCYEKLGFATVSADIALSRRV